MQLMIISVRKHAQRATRESSSISFVFTECLQKDKAMIKTFEPRFLYSFSKESTLVKVSF